MSQKFNVELIENYMIENSLSRTAFCKKCGISIRTLNKIFKGERFRTTVFLKMAPVMGVRFGDFFPRTQW